MLKNSIWDFVICTLTWFIGIGFGDELQLSPDLIGTGFLATGLSSFLFLGSLEQTSFFGSGISGSLTDEMLLLESFLLMQCALLSSKCLGTSEVWGEKPFSLVEWELELASGLVVKCLPAEHPIILAHEGQGTRQDNPMMKGLEP